jgi:hypothetical protein
LRAAGSGRARATRAVTRLVLRSGTSLAPPCIGMAGPGGTSGVARLCGGRFAGSFGPESSIGAVRFYFRGTEEQRNRATRWRQCYAIRTSGGPQWRSPMQAIGTRFASVPVFVLSARHAIRSRLISVLLRLCTSETNPCARPYWHGPWLKNLAAIQSRLISVPLRLCISETNPCARPYRHGPWLNVLAASTCPRPVPIRCLSGGLHRVPRATRQ